MKFGDMHLVKYEAQLRQAAREFTRLLDPYYWLTAYVIARNSITRQYKHSFLGATWMVLMPLMQVIILSLVMPMIMRFPIPHYIVFLVTSYSLWLFISSTLITSASAIIGQAETLKRCMVSSTVFPVASVLKGFYTYVVSFLTMYFFCVLFFVPFTPLTLLMPLYVIPVLIIMIALAVAVSFVAPYVRDVADLMVVGTSIAFWITPVVYPLQAVPIEKQFWFWLNPFFIMMYPIEELVYMNELPGWGATLALLALTLVTVAICYAIYRLCRRNYVYYL